MHLRIYLVIKHLQRVFKYKLSVGTFIFFYMGIGLVWAKCQPCWYLVWVLSNCTSFGIALVWTVDINVVWVYQVWNWTWLDPPTKLYVSTFWPSGLKFIFRNYVILWCTILFIRNLRCLWSACQEMVMTETSVMITSWTTEAVWIFG